MNSGWWLPEQKKSSKYSREARLLQMNLMSPIVILGSIEAVWLERLGFTVSSDCMLFPSSVQILPQQFRVMPTDWFVYGCADLLAMHAGIGFSFL